MHAYARTNADCRHSCLYFCHRLRPVHMPTVADKVQTCWTFKASADQRWHSSQSRKRSKVTEGRHVVLHRDVYGRIPTHTLACLYFYPRRNLRYMQWRRTGRRKRGHLRRVPVHTRAWSINPALAYNAWTTTNTYRQISNISCTLLENKINDHSDVVGASPLGAAPTISSL